MGDWRNGNAQGFDPWVNGSIPLSPTNLFKLK